MKPPVPGSKAWQVLQLRLARAVGKRPNRISTAAPAAKPINAPVTASAPLKKEKTMKKNSKVKASKSPKRSMSEASANLKAAKAKRGKSANTSIPRAKKADARARKTEGDGGVRAGSKLAIVAGLLQRPEGCTAAEILKVTGWPTCSVPQQARAAGLKLSKEKDGKVSRYRGTPLAA